jgi:hypothetical protein
VRTALALAATLELAALTLMPLRSYAAPNPAGGRCETGRLCLWAKPDFQGARSTYELAGTGTGSCVPLRPGAVAESLANRMGRPVTAYQSARCAETGEFETFPGDGVWLPRSTYQMRAFKVWEH